jgi:UDP-N-acetylmuramoyl-L-alanyl-D-glutamate--2,6-diaminopimelate ligase
VTTALTTLAKHLEVANTVGTLENVALTRAIADSRRVEPGDLYCCIVGSTADGHDFAAQAVAGGASALLVDHELDLDVPQLIVDRTAMRHTMALAAHFLKGNPATALTMCGVTGTNGKTTVTQMLGAILRVAGKPVTVIGTLSGARTTPEAPELAEYLGDARDEAKAISEVGAVAMEVSSHALALHRVDGLQFDVALFTNLSHDHLDFHHSMEEYFQAKAELFTKERAKRAVIFVDDAYGARLADQVEIPVVRVSMDLAEQIDLGLSGTWFTWRGVRVHVPMPGMVNVANALMALETAVALSVKPDLCATGIGAMVVVPGRLERVTGSGGSLPTVFVDYAHTPAGLKTVLTDLRNLMHESGKLSVVFGCGGDRDREKRSVMGDIASQLADSVFVTSDNPRSENPQAIVSAIVSGVNPANAEKVVVELDRQRAIITALNASAKEDVVVIAGKGHETGQVIGATTSPFDDAAVARDALSALRGEA